ncbi:MaoC family dehydratase [Bacteroidota bacterium]
MGKLVVNSHAEFEQHVGELIGISDYLKITQEQINLFAEATLDHQWIHVDVERAKKESPFGTTIAHGYLTLSILPYLWEQIIEVNNLKLQVNYGIEKLRYGTPVPVNGEVRVNASLKALTNLRGISKAEIDVTLELKDSKKPVLNGIIVFLYHFDNN